MGASGSPNPDTEAGDGRASVIELFFLRGDPEQNGFVVFHLYILMGAGGESTRRERSEHSE